MSKVYELIEEQGPMTIPALISQLRECTNSEGRRKAEWGQVKSGNSLAQSMRACGLFRITGDTVRVATVTGNPAKYSLWGIKRTATEMAEEWLSKTHKWRRMSRLPVIVQKEIKRLKGETSPEGGA